MSSRQQKILAMCRRCIHKDDVGMTDFCQNIRETSWDCPSYQCEAKSDKLDLQHQTNKYVSKYIKIGNLKE